MRRCGCTSARTRSSEDQHLVVEWAKLAAEHGDSRQSRKLYKRVLDDPKSASPYAFQCAAALEIGAGDAEAARALFKRGAACVAAPPKGLKRTTSDAAAAALTTLEGDRAESASAELMPMLHAWAVFEWREASAPRQGALPPRRGCS